MITHLAGRGGLFLAALLPFTCDFATYSSCLKTARRGAVSEPARLDLSILLVQSKSFQVYFASDVSIGFLASDGTVGFCSATKCTNASAGSRRRKRRGLGRKPSGRSAAPRGLAKLWAVRRMIATEVRRWLISDSNGVGIARCYSNSIRSLLR